MKCVLARGVSDKRCVCGSQPLFAVIAYWFYLLQSNEMNDIIIFVLKILLKIFCLLCIIHRKPCLYRSIHII